MGSIFEEVVVSQSVGQVLFRETFHFGPTHNFSDISLCNFLLRKEGSLSIFFKFSKPNFILKENNVLKPRISFNLLKENNTVTLIKSYKIAQ